MANERNTEMRDGSTARDPRLGWIGEFDSRSLNYPMLALLGGKKPRSYTWRLTGPVYQQGDMGRCVGCGFGHAINARPATAKPILSLDYVTKEIYFRAQEHYDHFAGGDYPGAQPQSGGTSVLAGARAAYVMGWFATYRWNFRMTEIALSIAYNGPVITGFNWYTDMMETDSRGFVQASGSIEGGHCTAFTGVNVREEYYTFPNSWGSTWGKNGYGKIRFADVEKLMHERGEAMSLVGKRVSPIPPPDWSEE